MECRGFVRRELCTSRLPYTLFYLVCPFAASHFAIICMVSREARAAHAPVLLLFSCRRLAIGCLFASCLLCA